MFVKLNWYISEKLLTCEKIEKNPKLLDVKAVDKLISHIIAIKSYQNSRTLQFYGITIES